MKQIAINLIRNAAEAMEHGGNIFISTRHETNPLSSPAGRDGKSSPGLVQVAVRDDGPGIPETMQTRIFDPYVTTKGAKHSGLGLAIVFQLVKELQGTVSCKSTKEDGTCFQMVFPIHQNQES